MSGGDVLLGDETQQVVGLLVAAGAGEHETRAHHEGPEELPDGDVEAEGRLLQHDVLRRPGR